MAGFTTSTQTNRQDLAFTPESLQALMADLAHFQNNVLPKLAGVHTSVLDLLSGRTPENQSLAAQPTLKAAALGREAVGGAAAQRGLAPRTSSALEDYLASQEPAQLSGLDAAARGIAGGVDSLVDPRLASFLKPDVISSSSTDPSVLDTTTKVLSGLGSVAGAFAN